MLALSFTVGFSSTVLPDDVLSTVESSDTVLSAGMLSDVLSAMLSLTAVESSAAGVSTGVSSLAVSPDELSGAVVLSETVLSVGASSLDDVASVDSKGVASEASKFEG